MNHLLAAGGPVIWVLAALSVAVMTVILWKLWQLLAAGVWRQEAPVLAALAATAARDHKAGISAEMSFSRRERQANTALRDLRAGLRLLETAAVLAPLLGLLGTVLGMIEAFRALEATGGSATPATLAGGIWEALLTTAFGMTIAIPAAAALSLFDGGIERLRHRMEDEIARPFPEQKDGGT